MLAVLGSALDAWIVVALVLAGLAVALMLVIRIGLYPPTPVDLGGAPDLDPEARRVRIAVGDDAIDGWWIPGVRPASILMLHGHGRTHHRVWRYAIALRDAGYGLLTIDFRCSRARSRLPATLGIHELADAESALLWLTRERPHDRLGVLGESLGGTVAILLAARHPEVCAVAVDGAFATGRRALEDFACWLRLPSGCAAAMRRVTRWVTGHDPFDCDATIAARALAQRPMFFVHGLVDRRLGTHHARMLWESAGSKDELWWVPDAGHNEAWLRARDEYERRLRAFFDAALEAPAGAGR